MKAGPQILSELARRALSEQLSATAQIYGVPPLSLCTGGTAREISARHAFWRLAVVRLGSLNAVASIFGVESASVLCSLRAPVWRAAERALAEESAPLAPRRRPRKPSVEQVLLAYEAGSGRHAFQLRWNSGRSNPFGVTDRVRGSTTWFGSYRLAREVYDACISEVDAETSFAAAAKGAG